MYCLMVTGHKPSRIPYAKKSVHNFLNQTYENKHLVVLNQGADAVLSDDEHLRDNMLEVFVDNRGKTLGEIRNMSLQFVPPNAIWTTWDDDDWRAPVYLATMERTMRDNGSDFLMFQNRVEYNLLNGFAFRLTLRSGLMTFFARNRPDLQYAHSATSEDRPLKDYARRHLKTHLMDNDPKLYVRLVHGDNTSVYVDKHKHLLRDTTKNKDFFEQALSDEEKAFVSNIISGYYNK